MGDGHYLQVPFPDGSQQAKVPNLSHPPLGPMFVINKSPFYSDIQVIFYHFYSLFSYCNWSQAFAEATTSSAPSVPCPQVASCSSLSTAFQISHTHWLRSSVVIKQDHWLLSLPCCIFQRPHTLTHLDTHSPRHTLTYTHTLSLTHTLPDTHSPIHIYTHTHLYTHTNLYTHSPTHTHLHTLLLSYTPNILSLSFDDISTWLSVTLVAYLVS